MKALARSPTVRTRAYRMTRVSTGGGLRPRGGVSESEALEAKVELSDAVMPCSRHESARPLKQIK